MNDQTQLGIFEAGISERGEMAALRDIIQPTIAIITNLGSAHQENFSSLEEKCAEKMQLFHDAKTIVYNADDDLIRHQAEAITDFKGERLVWSQKDRNVAMYVKSIEKKPTMTTVAYSFKQGDDDWFSIPFVDSISACNNWSPLLCVLR